MLYQVRKFLPGRRPHVTAPDHAVSSQKVLARAPSTRDPKRTLNKGQHMLCSVERLYYPAILPAACLEYLVSAGRCGATNVSSNPRHISEPFRPKRLLQYRH